MRQIFDPARINNDEHLVRGDSPKEYLLIRSKYSKAGFLAACVATSGLVLAPVNEAKADHPIAVALIGAGGTVLAASIAGAATVAAAVIVVVGSNNNGGKGGEDKNGEVIVPGTDENGNIITNDSTQENTSGDLIPIENEMLAIEGALGANRTGSVGQSGVDPSIRSYVSRSASIGLRTVGQEEGLGVNLSY
ncbi:MAG: hypothetical protein AAFV29_16440, partial [Myxococcota bacterium]